MEALGAVGSVFAVTTVALQSSRVVYETISGIKNGPKEVKELASGVQQLCHILEQVTEISKKAVDRDAKNIFELQGVIDQCRQNIDDFQKQFENFEVSSDERRLGKAWKRVKLVVQKEDFRRMRITVTHYINVLGVHLDLIGREMDNNHKVEFSRSVLQTSADSQLLRQNNGILMQIGKSLSSVGSDLARQETQRSTEITMIQNGHQAAQCLGERLNDLGSMSKDQNENLLEKLIQLQAQIGELKTSFDQTSKMHPSTDGFSDNLRQEEENKNHENNHHSKELSASINRLCSLATKPRKTVFSHEAQRIISDIEKILILVSKTSKFTETNETRKRKNDQMADFEFAEGSIESQQGLDLRRMQGLLTSSQHISVNQRTSSGVNLSSEDRRHRKTTTQNYVTELGLVSVQVKRRKLLKDAESQDDVLIDEVDRGIVNIFEGTVSLIPAREFSRTKISTSFLQKSTENGYFSLKPTLSFCAIIPENSQIFTLTREGDLEGIINHVQQGHASLTDCDSKGRTLLNYALRTCQVEVSKFLIEKGADVDAIEPGIYDDDHAFLLEGDEKEESLPHLLQIMKHSADPDKDDTKFDLSWRCRRLLLDAGADPTIRTPDRHARSFLSKDSLKKTFDLGAEFINLEDVLRDDGCTPLLLCSHGYGDGVSPQFIKFLLGRGANVTAKDKYGNTCLHFVLQNARPRRYASSRDPLILLIQAGADVYATTNWGESVSDQAYTYRKWAGKGRSFSPGDEWEEALTACGYDAAWFREDFRRRYPAGIEEQEENSDVDEGGFESNEEKSDVYERGLEGNEQGLEDVDGDEQNLQDNKWDFEDFVGDEQNLQDNKRGFDLVMQDSNIPSSTHGHNSLNSTQSGFVLPRIDEMINGNIWNHADYRPEEDSLRPVNQQNCSPWAENLSDAYIEWGWNSIPPQHTPHSNSPLLLNNKIFETEEGVEAWDKIWG